LAAGHANLFDSDHQLTLAFTTSLERPAAVNQAGLNYRVPLYRLGGVLGASYTQSSVLGDFGSFKSTGTGRTVGINYNHYLPPIGGFRSYLGIALDDKQFDVTQFNGVALPGAVGSPQRAANAGLQRAHGVRYRRVGLQSGLGQQRADRRKRQ
jgi:hemolysin activation/secretion protein